MVTDNFPTTDGAAIGNWPRIYPDSGNMTPIRTTAVSWLDNIPWMNGVNAGGTGYHALPSVTTGQVVTRNGGSIVVAVQPQSDGVADHYQDVVSVLLNRLSICISKGDNTVWVGLQAGDFGPNFNTGYRIPNGQKTVLSLVCQPTGQSVLYANGNQIWSTNTTADMTALSTTAWWDVDINVGMGWNGDTWSAFNGRIGDVFVYKTALSQANRILLENGLGTKYGISLPAYHTITASAGTGGSISPSGSVAVVHGSDQTFTMTPDTGNAVLAVLVDGSSVAAVTSYTFTAVTADTHTIAVSFASALSPYQQWLAANGNLPDTPENLRTDAFGLDLTGGASPVRVTLDSTTGECKYTRRKDTGLTFSYESSARLANWQEFTPDAPTPTVAGIDASLEQVTIKIPAGLLGTTKLFVRVKTAE